MRFVFILVAYLLTHIASAATPIDGWYTSVFGGYTNLPNNIDSSSGGALYSDASYHAGYNAGGSIGFKSNALRYEGQITYFDANLKKFSVNHIPQTGVTGNNDAVVALGNVYFDFYNLLNCLQPYVGMGLGYAWINATLYSTGPLGVSHFSGSNTVFAYQPTVGLTYNFAENYALNIGYRYLATAKPNELGKLYQANLASIGAVYRFDERRYK
jgi:opacity protein-like surface antigen